MKSISVVECEQTAPDFTFPCLLVYPSDGVVIFAIGYNQTNTGVFGTCVHTGTNTHIKLGETRVTNRGFSIDSNYNCEVKLYNGKLELTNH